MKLAVSHALAQSSKLLVYEERVWQLVEKVGAWVVCVGGGPEGGGWVVV